jgi:prepilin-type N-terminal cleavage/methylation domain-containing protein
MELNAPRAAQCRLEARAWRRLRHGEQGFTLTEVIIAIALLTLVGASLAGAFAIGLRVLGPTGAQAALRGNNDLLAFEQQIGADIARANCLAAGAVLIPSTGCSTFNSAVGGTPSARCPSPYVLCVGWYMPGAACHEVVYSAKSTGSDMWIERRDLNTGTAARVSTGGLSLSAINFNPSQTSNNAYNWTKQVDITVTQQKPPLAPPLRHAASAIFHAVPLAADPLSSVPPGVPAC